MGFFYWRLYCRFIGLGWAGFSIKGIILSLVTLAPLVLAGEIWLQLPSVYDVSSDVDNPPLYPVASDNVMGRPIGALPPLTDFSGQADLQMETWPDLSGRRYDTSPDGILTAIETVFETKGWSGDLSIIQGQENEILVTSVVRVPILGFASDVVIRLEDKDDATRVDMRMTSRDLPHDFGFGAYSIIEFMQMLDREVLLGAIERLKEESESDHLLR